MNLNKKPLALLLVSFNVSALTPAPAQPPAIFLENQTNLQVPAISTSAPAPEPAQPVSQQLLPTVQPEAQNKNQPMPSPAPTTPAQSAPAPVPATASTKPEESSYGKQIQQLSEEIELLSLKKKKGELQEEVNKHDGGNADKGSSHPSPEPEQHESNADITVHSIYGVNRTYTAVIYYRGVEMVVRPGSEINGDWKVTSVTATTVKIKKAGKTKTLSLSAASLPLTPPQQLPVSPVPQQPGFGLLNRTGQ